jgi:DNA replication protein DnaC
MALRKEEVQNDRRKRYEVGDVRKMKPPEEGRGKWGEEKGREGEDREERESCKERKKKVKIEANILVKRKNFIYIKTNNKLKGAGAFSLF